MAGRLEAAISTLADLFEYGHLQAQTDPAAFIEQVAAEIAELRAELKRVKEERDAARLDVLRSTVEKATGVTLGGEGGKP